LNLEIKSFYLRVSFENSPAKEASNDSNLCCSDRTSHKPCDIGAAPEYFGSLALPQADTIGKKVLDEQLIEVIRAPHEQ
jgi:hypothetical protein